MLTITKTYFYVLLCLLPWQTLHAQQSFETQEGILVFSWQAKAPVKGQVLWLPSEYGVLQAEKELAAQLAQQGYHVWLPDFFNSLFLPEASSSLQKIPLPAITQLILQAQPHKDAPLWVISANQGAKLALNALQKSQIQQHLGLLFINPNLYTQTPNAGDLADYIPAVHQSNLPIYLLQAELSPWRWQLESLATQLQQNKSDVFLHLLPKVRDRFYFRPDAMNIEKQQQTQLVNKILQGFQLLSPWLAEKRQQPSVLQNLAKSTTQNNSGQLQVYQGAQNLPLRLQDLHNQTHHLANYHGKVVLLNFWASWCPPCVHEMPSMAKLKSTFATQDFEILAANLGEEKPAVESFIKQHPVNFPILLDPQGEAVQSWQIFAYPSSFILDKSGKIRYALLGGYDWNNEQAQKTIQQLLQE